MTNLLRGVRAYRARSYAAIERIALEARRRIAPEVGLDEPLNGLHLLEHLDEYSVKVRGVSIPLIGGAEELPLGIEAQARYDARNEEIVVALEKRTYAELRRAAPRAVFTVAHEIGHAVLHAAELVDRGLAAPDPRAMQRALPEHKPYHDTEWQANSFAAALLMPARGLLLLEKRGVDLDAFVITEHFSVSTQAAEVRLRTYQTRKLELI